VYIRAITAVNKPKIFFTAFDLMDDNYIISTFFIDHAECIPNQQRKCDLYIFFGVPGKIKKMIAQLRD
jgi:hypothetical protein